MKALFSTALIGVAAQLFCVASAAQDRLGDADYVPAQIITTPRVAPPQEAIASGLGGVVSVQISIDEAGNVTSADYARGPGTVCQNVTRADVVALRLAAKEASLLARFSPATKKGKAVSSSIWLDFTFPGSSKEADFMAAPPTSDGRNYSEVPAPDSDGIKYTIKGDAASSKSIAPPPDYRGPVNIGGSGTAAIRSPVTPGERKLLSGGVLNGKANSLAKPPYPPAARAVRASGAVSVQVLIDESGDVFSAHAVFGHPLLRSASVIAACNSKFLQTQLSGEPVSVAGIIVYNFVP